MIKFPNTWNDKKCGNFLFMFWKQLNHSNLVFLLLTIFSIQFSSFAEKFMTISKETHGKSFCSISFMPNCGWGWWKGVHVHAELRGTLIRALRVSKYITLWYMHVPRSVQSIARTIFRTFLVYISTMNVVCAGTLG